MLLWKPSKETARMMTKALAFAGLLLLAACGSSPGPNGGTAATGMNPAGTATGAGGMGAMGAQPGAGTSTTTGSGGNATTQ
jgi:hypothetical protein